MKTNRKQQLEGAFKGVAWLILFSGFAGTFRSALALSSMPANDPGYALTTYSMYYVVPLVYMICPLLAFEGWTSLRTGDLNPWPTVLLIYICLASSFAIYSGLTTQTGSEDLLSLRQHLIGPLPIFNACSLVAIYGFYVCVLVRQASKLPFAVSCGRAALCLWLLYFTVTRLWQPIRVVNQILRAMF